MSLNRSFLFVSCLWWVCMSLLALLIPRTVSNTWTKKKVLQARKELVSWKSEIIFRGSTLPGQGDLKKKRKTGHCHSRNKKQRYGSASLCADPAFAKRAALFWFGLRDVGICQIFYRKNNCWFSRIFGVRFGGKDRDLCGCAYTNRDPNKQEVGFIFVCSGSELWSK